MVNQKLINYIKKDLKDPDRGKIKNILVEQEYPKEVADNDIKAVVEANELKKGAERKKEEKEKKSIKKLKNKKKLKELKKKTIKNAKKNSKVLVFILIIIILGTGFFVFSDFFDNWIYNIKNKNSLALDINFENNYLINGNLTVIKDNSKYENDGILKGESKLVDTDFGKVVELSNGSYVEVKDSNSLDIADAITIEALIYTYNVSKIQTIMAKGDNPDLYVAIFNNSVLFHLHEGKDIPNHMLFSNTKLEDNVWYVITLTYNGSMIEMYINGRQEEDLAFANRYWDGGIQVDDHNLLIGINEKWKNESFDGLIKSIKIYNSALTGKEIKRSYRGLLEKYNTKV